MHHPILAYARMSSTASHPIPSQIPSSHPIPSHPIPSHPIPSHPTSSHPTSSHPTRPTPKDSRTSTASIHNEEDETRRQIPREHGRDDHVPSAKACQVPRRAKCQGARPISHHDETQHAGTSGGPTRTPRTHEDSQTTARAHVPGAKACQVPRRAKCQGVFCEVGEEEQQAVP